jgi:agmatine deiminase
MPAEWERHDALWLAWPYDRDTFPGLVPQVEETYLDIIEAIHRGEKVHLLVRDEVMEQRVLRALDGRGIEGRRISFYRYDYADVWLRDSGPIFVTRREEPRLAMVDWVFNAWGLKYRALERDTHIPEFINETLKIPRFTPGLVLEGGSVDVNGCGTLMTTKQCLLNSNRNPRLDKKEIEQVLRAYLGIEEILWLREGIAGDDTDGHIDDIARFVDPKTICCAFEEDEEDVNYEALRENHELLLEARDHRGDRFDIVKLPMPDPMMGADGRLPASYANFYIGNERVLVPVFKDPNDEKACGILQELFPERNVIGIDCRALVHGLGTLHCISRQQPAVD